MGVAMNTTTETSLQPGRYWLTFAWGGDTHRRRVILRHDDAGVLRSVWADEHWVAYPPVGPNDIGLRVDEFDSATLLEPETEATNVDTGHGTTMSFADDNIQAGRARSRVDSQGRGIRPGRYRLSTGSGSVVEVDIVEDQLNFDLWFTVATQGRSVRQRVDELADDVVFTRLS